MRLRQYKTFGFYLNGKELLKQVKCSSLKAAKAKLNFWYPENFNIQIREIGIVRQLIQELRENDYKGDRWAVAMGAFFDCATRLYEEGEVPAEWDFKVGAMGNFVDDETAFYQFFRDQTPEQLVECGNYLHRLTEVLRKSKYHY